MKKFAELGTAHRGDPCVEYPGSWLVFVKGEETNSCSTLDEAFNKALSHVEVYDSVEQIEPINISIGWKCSDNDPRIGEIWFTSFYQYGKFNLFGAFKAAA